MKYLQFPVLCALTVTALAGSASAGDTRYLAFDAADRVTRAMTQGLTFEVERGLFGAIRVERIYSTTNRGQAEITRGGPAEVRSALPEDARAAVHVYQVADQGDGPRLVRALCPTADAAWLVTERVRLARPLTIQVVGRWPDGTYRHCVQLSYSWRGEWALPPGRAVDAD